MSDLDTRPVEDVDLSALDDGEHIICLGCYPDRSTPALAMCGAKVSAAERLGGDNLYWSRCSDPLCWGCVEVAERGLCPRCGVPG